MTGQPTAVVFDLGGVLIDWDPRHLYRRLFDDEDAMERFLEDVATTDWNRQQDAGRPWAEAIEALAADHPEARVLIEAYHRRWPEMLGGAVAGSVELLAELHEAGVPVYALSNWSAETFPDAAGRFAFLGWFDGVLISGEVGVVKPDPRIFEELVRRYRLDPGRTVFIDDQPQNVEAAARLGFVAVLFRGADALGSELRGLGLLPSVDA
jgi:2-haloacid dehalogenase